MTLLARYAAHTPLPNGSALTPLRLRKLIRAIATEHQPSQMPTIEEVVAELAEPPAGCSCEECRLRRNKV
jgi:hypothetical protein